MSEEERQAIIHLLDKQARYEYCIKNNISFSDEDYEAYIIRQSMINKDKEIERLNNIIKEVREYIEKNTEEKKSWLNGIPDYTVFKGDAKELLEILDKEN